MGSTGLAMHIIFNGESREVAAGTTLGSLLRELNVPARRVAVEVNRELVPRGRHDEVALQEGDQLEVVTLVGGG